MTEHMPTRGQVVVDGLGMASGPAWTEADKARMIAIYQDINPDSVVRWEPLPCCCDRCVAR